MNAPVALAVERAHEAELVISQIGQCEPARVLDIGCGDGLFFEFIRPRLPKLFAVGTDVSLGELRKAKERASYDALVVASADQLPFADRSFDFIMSNSVLEHIETIENVISGLGRLLSPRGFFWFAVPHLGFTEALAHGRPFGRLYARAINAMYKHYNLWPKERWIAVCAASGLSIVESDEYYGARLLLVHEIFLPAFIFARVTKAWLGRWLIAPSVRPMLRSIFLRLGDFLASRRENSFGAIWFLAKGEDA